MNTHKNLASTLIGGETRGNGEANSFFGFEIGVGVGGGGGAETFFGLKRNPLLGVCSGNYQVNIKSS